MVTASEQLQDLLRKIAALKQDLQPTTNPDAIGLHRDLNRLTQAEHHLDSLIKIYQQSFEEQETATNRSFQQLRELQTLARQSCKLYKKGQLVESKRLWLEHLEALAGAKGPHRTPDPKGVPHWLRIAKHLQNLSQKKQILEKRILELRNKREQLEQDHHLFQLELANLESARSLQASWGKAALAPNMHPMMREMALLLNSYRRAVYERPDERAAFQKLCQRYHETSKRLLNECKTLIEQSDRKKLEKQHIGRLRDLQQEILEIGQLEKKLDTLSERLRHLPTTNSALVVTKSKKNGKKPTSR